MTWNYRIIHHDNALIDDDWFGIHEVYYKKDNSIASYTEQPSKIIGESLEEIPEIIGMMIKAFTLPVLKKSEIKFDA